MGKFFYLDSRSLALFRIALGLVLLLDLWVRSTELTAHYTDEGVMPRIIFEQSGKHSLWMGPHFLGGSPSFLAFIFILHALCAIALIIGYQTQIATFLCWILLLSLHDRNTIILNGGDIFFRMLFFWSLFLPLGHSWSLESREPPKKICGFPAIALLLQVCLVYWMSVIHKWNIDWLSGKAVGYALSIDQFTTSFGIWLRQQTILYKPLTYLTLGVEFFGPLLVCLPWRNGLFRTLGVFLMILTHLSFGSALELGMFPAICIVAWLPFLPSSFWERKKKTTLPLEELSSSTRTNLVATTLMLYIVSYNIVDTYFLKEHWSPLWKLPAAYLHIDQRWNMFERPLRDSGWYVVIGKVAKKEAPVDLWNERLLTWQPPTPISSNFPNARWRKYLMNLYWVDQKKYRPYFVDYVVKRWEKEHPEEHIHAAQMVFVLNKISENFEKPDEKKLPLFTKIY